ncbi:MAG: ABC transporter ATP-binding protein [Treponema sp.]|jgi:simple sugar transport system ATP-binding protein|nr:ABC transporter ATP-binding protein [Treponema sp.]
MIGITKIFPGVTANDKVNLEVNDGEIHALLGENGAGKSTLMSILFGLYKKDEGVIKIRGKEKDIRGPKDAAALGIGMVHQHFKLIHNFTVTENIVLGMEPRIPFWGNLDFKTAEKRVEQLSALYGLEVDPRAKIYSISIGMQQRVEILKILYRNARILIFDEPSSVLGPAEIKDLLKIFKRLKSEEKTIIFITHKLQEIKAVADRCTVLSRGKNVGMVTVADSTEQKLAEMMIGPVKFPIKKMPLKSGELILKIENLTVTDPRGTAVLSNFSLEARAGEIVGIAGVDGNGQSELAAAIAGLIPVKSGRILLKGKDLSRLSIRERNENGLGLAPEDRHKHGLILAFRLDENLILKSFHKNPYSSLFGFLRFPVIAKHTDTLIKEFNINAGNGPTSLALTMSGGNQQKTIIAREIDRSPDLLIIFQPARGLDLGAAKFIHRRIVDERNKGKALLLISYDLNEIMTLSDRIVVISGGQVMGEVPVKKADERQISAMMAGILHQKNKSA